MRIYIYFFLNEKNNIKLLVIIQADTYTGFPRILYSHIHTDICFILRVKECQQGLFTSLKMSRNEIKFNKLGNRLTNYIDVALSQI